MINQLPQGMSTTPAVQSTSRPTCSSHQSSTWTTFPFLQRAQGPPMQRGGQRCSFLSWNAGGLTSATWQELMQFLSQHAIDIACIQGTRWSTTLDWSTFGYWAISAGTEDRRDHGGLLTLVSHRLCRQQDLSSSSPIPGHYRACCQGHNGWISFQDNWEARLDHALHQEPEQDVLLVLLVAANQYLTCPPAATPSALMKDELITHAVRCYAQANYMGSSKPRTHFCHASCVRHVLCVAFLS